MKSKDDWFQIIVRLCYHTYLALFVILQTSWILLANRYHTKTTSPLGKFFTWLTFLHVIALNIVIYLKTTLDEAKHSFQELGGANSKHAKEHRKRDINQKHKREDGHEDSREEGLSVIYLWLSTPNICTTTSAFIINFKKY